MLSKDGAVGWILYRKHDTYSIMKSYAYRMAMSCKELFMSEQIMPTFESKKALSFKNTLDPQISYVKCGPTSNLTVASWCQSFAYLVWFVHHDDTI